MLHNEFLYTPFSFDITDSPASVRCIKKRNRHFYFFFEIDTPLDSWTWLTNPTSNSPSTATTTSGDTTVASPRKQANRFICNYGGCHKSFSRRYDLQRHNEVHSPLHAYWCRAQGCKRNEAVIGAKPFPRKDKRDDHERKAHPSTTQ